MPKKFEFEFVLHDWLGNLTFQTQALLLTGVRGADGTTKHNSAKEMSRYLRGVVLKPAGNWSGANNNTFMWGDYKLFDTSASIFMEDHDAYPHHFIMHLVHCAEVIAYKHPVAEIRSKWFTFYVNACDSFHMHVETEIEMGKRLNDFGEGWLK